MLIVLRPSTLEYLLGKVILRKYIFFVWASVFLLTGVPFHKCISQQSIYSCSTDFYYYNVNNRLYGVDINDQFTEYTVTEVGGQDWGTNNLAGLGYNSSSKKVYGIDDLTSGYPYLVALDSLGDLETLLKFGENEFSFNTFNAATVSLDNKFFYALRRTGFSLGNIVSPALLYRFDITENPVTYDSVFVQTESGAPSTTMIDMAINPVDGLAYGFDAINRKLVTLDLDTGMLDDLRYPVVADVNDVTTLMTLRFSPFGEIIGFNSQPNFRIVTVSTSTGLVEREITPGPIFNNQGGVGDGFYCPYTIALRQRAQQDSIPACGSFTAEVIVGVVSDGNNVLELRDTFPDGFVVEEVIRNPYGGTVGGLGTNVFTLGNFTADNGVDTILLRVTAGPAVAPGRYTFQATLNDAAQSTSAFPANTIRSDYLPSQAARDPSPVFVREPLTAGQPDSAFQRCAGDVLVLDPFPFSLDDNLSFAWSTGETEPEITVNEGGTYTLVTTDLCGVTDTFNFTVTDGSVAVDLGPDLAGTYGNTFPLVPAIVTTADLQTLRYFTTDSSILSCTDCANPRVTPTAAVTNLRLEVETVFGCRATDSLTIRLERPLYQPTAFSPNGDGINDCFQVYAGGPVTSTKLEIFDRWGGLVFSGTGGEGACSSGWDGRVNGKIAPSGVYVYAAELTFPDGSIERLKGVFTLLR